MPLWIALKHVSNLHFSRRLRIVLAQVPNAMRFDPLEDVTTKVLAVYLPVGLQILASGHEQAHPDGLAESRSDGVSLCLSYECLTACLHAGDVSS